MRKINKIFLAIIIVTSLLFGCRQEKESKKEIDSIKFAETAKTIFVGDVVTIDLNVSPNDAKNSEIVTYSLSSNDIVEIKDGSSNDGVVVEGLNRGSVVITARTKNSQAYCNVIVGGMNENIIPHIIVPTTVIEMPVNERRVINVSLAGGTPADNSNFIWSYEGQRYITFEGSQNVGIINSVELGESVITVRHPKAQYDVKILVYVVGVDEIPVYITGSSNVMQLQLEKEYGINKAYEYKVELRGGSAEEQFQIQHQIVEGRDVLEFDPGGNIATGQNITIRPKKVGSALIEVSHWKTSHVYQIQVFINADLEFNVIEVDKSFVILNEGDNDKILAAMSGDVPEDVKSKYGYELSDYGIVEITQAQDLFFINALSGGKVVLKIKNQYADFDREILIIVSSGNNLIFDNEKYITTNQNVISLEIGGLDSVLKMYLVGGNEADRNNFTWYVEDSSIIEVRAENNGIVKNDQLPQRSQINPNIKIEYSEFEAQALISPKKVGVTKIVLEHPKSKNDSSILVKVYPRGTFGVTPIILGGNPVHKVVRGASVNANLYLESGNDYDIGTLNWSIDNPQTASVSGNGLTGVITGNRIGITNIMVEGENLKHPYRAVLMVSENDNFNDQKLIYTKNPYINLTTGQSVMVQIECENMTNDELRALSIVNNNQDIVRADINNGAVVLRGLNVGEVQVVVSGAGTNEIRIYVTVESEIININYPYSLKSDRMIVGVVKNQTIDFEVNLIGGNARAEEGIVWKSDNEDIVTVVGNGKSARITGVNNGQTKIKASHPKSVNTTLDIVVYVVTNENELNNKVVLYVDKTNYLIERNERIHITLTTNATDAQKAMIEWQIDNDGIAELGVSGDKVTAFVTGVKEGVTRISATHPDNLVATSIYISVVNRKQGLKYIGVPSIIEAVKMNNLKIEAVTQNLDAAEIYDIKWIVEDVNIATVVGTGETCVIQPKENGKTNIIVRQESLSYEKKIVLYVYNSYEEAAASYLINSENSFYRIGKDDIIDISLIFGARGFPEHEINNIRWSTEDSSVIQVTGNGKKATVRGLNEGIGRIKVQSDIARNREIDIEVEVTGKIVANNEYRFVINDNDKIKGLVNGRYADIILRVFRGQSEIFTDYSKITYTVDDASKVNINLIDNNLRVTARDLGQTYVRLSHPQIADELTIMVCVVNNEGELNNLFPIMFDKINYLLRKGDNIRIQATTINDDVAKLSGISYLLDKNNGTINLNQISKKEITVTAVERGIDTVLVLYNGNIVERLYISVTETTEADLVTYMVTESVIGIVKGQIYNTKVNTNMDSNLLSMISWSSEDYTKVGIDSWQGTDAVLRGVNTGRTYVNVRSSGLERKILVIVVDSENQLREINAVNIDNRYHVIGRGQNVNLKLFSYRGSVSGTTTYTDFFNYSGNFSNIISVENQSNEGIVIKGVQEGIAAIRIQNSYYDLDIVVYVEVNERAHGNVNNTRSDNYLTASQTLYIIDMEIRDVRVNVNVISREYFGWESYFEWYGFDDTIISLTYLGNSAIVNPIRRGETKATVRHPYCENEIEITFIVGDRFILETTDEPYVYSENLINEMLVNDNPIIVYYEVRNSSFEDFINFMQEGESVSINYTTPGRLIVSPRFVGMTKFTISLTSGARTDIYFIVRNTDISGAVYLTTNENFIIAGVGEMKNVDVRLVGYNEVDSNQYKWKSQNESIARVVGNGNRGQIIALAYGETVITVEHDKTSNKIPLKINLKVTKDTSEKLVYLTTGTNVIETVASDVSEYIYVQKIGGSAAEVASTWTIDRPDIATVSGNNLTGVFTPRREGIAKITVTNNEIKNRPLEIILIVNSPSGTNNYIRTDTALIEVEPGMVGRRIKVELVGGEEKDQAMFNWSVYHQTPSDVRIAQNNGNVITITGNGDECIVNTVNDGKAVIRVTHAKADNPLYITVLVTKYRTVTFSRNQLELLKETSEFLAINVPTYEDFKDKVIYTSDNESVAYVVGVGKSALVVAKEPGFAIIKAKIEGKEEYSELYVTVVDEIPAEATTIVTPRTSYLINPRANPMTVMALLAGENAIYSENQNIEWVIIDEDPCISIFPREGKGQEIQITPKWVGEANIEIRHWGVDPKYWKTINILVSEYQDALTLDKQLIRIETNETAQLTVNIVDGSSRDYNNVEWIVESNSINFDGSYKEVVRVMGTGRTITLMGRNEGECTVTAMYAGTSLRQQCRVIVENAQYFGFQVLAIKMYPGQELEVKYDLRPMGVTYPRFFSTDDGLSDRVVDYMDVITNSALRIRALKEGSVSITGTAFGHASTVQVMVAYDYKVMADTGARMPPLVEYHDEPMVINYKVYPDNTYIEVIGLPNDAVREISIPDEKGNGTIKIWYTKELAATTLRIVQYTPERQATGKEATTIIRFEFPDLETPRPYFLRYAGEWSNSILVANVPNVGSTYSPKRRSQYLSQTTGEMLGEQIGRTADNQEYEMIVGDGEHHYILFDKKYANSHMEIKDIKVTGIGSSDWEKYLVIQRQNLEHNGITQPAIRIEGKSGDYDKPGDWIVYDRVKLEARPYIDVESRHVNASNGGSSSSFVQFEPIYEEEINLLDLIGYEYIYENLWHKEDYFIYGNETYYLYTQANYQQIIGSNPSLYAGDFILISSIENMPPYSSEYTWASKKSVYLIEGVGGFMGALYSVPLKKFGYYYNPYVVQNNMELFEDVYELLETELGGGSDLILALPLNRQIIKTTVNPVYDAVDYYIYNRNNLISDEGYINDIYDEGEIKVTNIDTGVSAYILEQIESGVYKLREDVFTDEGDVLEFFDVYVLSTKKYFYRNEMVIINETGDTPVSTWDVFKAKGNIYSEWSKGFGLRADSIQIRFIRPNMSGGPWAKLHYFGLTYDPAYAKSSITSTTYNQQGQSITTTTTRYSQITYGEGDHNTSWIGVRSEDYQEVSCGRWGHSTSHYSVAVRDSYVPGAYITRYRQEYRQIGNGQYGYVNVPYEEWRPAYYNYLTTSANTSSTNILPKSWASQNGRNKVGTWSNTYRMQNFVAKHESCSSRSTVPNLGTKARQRIRWVDTGTRYIVPIYYLDVFPFRAHSIGYHYYVSEMPGSVPMPSIDTNPDSNNRMDARIEIKYQLFGGAEQFMYIRIIYQRRPCHMLYKGESKEMNDDESHNASFSKEVQGVENWSEI